jgi:hypothetical protein
MQGNFECIEKASSEDGVVRVEHVDDIKMMYAMRGFFGVPNDTCSVMTSIYSILFFCRNYRMASSVL